MTDDPRLPVTVYAEASALAEALRARPAAVLVAAPASPPAGALQAEVFEPIAARHWGGCACCAGRSAAAMALDRLFQRRARAQGAWFDSVLALAPPGSARTMLLTALREDRVAAARFRLVD